MANIGVSSERLSRVAGFNLGPGNKAVASQNFPISIAILAEANRAYQTEVDFNVAKEVTSAEQAGRLYGWGSPIHQIMAILRPTSGDLVGGIPTVVYPIAEAGSAAAAVKSIAATGTATGNGTHTVVIAGRRFKNSGRYDITVLRNDTAAMIATKIYDAVNAVLEAPVTAALDSPVTKATLTAKWRGASSDFSVSVDTNGNDLGVTYAVTTDTAAAGIPAVTTALTNFGSRWNSLVINGIGSDSATMTAFESWNGIPSNETPTGRYIGTTFKPAIVFTGSTLANPSNITSDRRNNCTICIAPAPNSAGFAFEAAANMVAAYAPIAQNNPHLDLTGRNYPDMPVPADGVIGVMSSYNERDAISKLGCSTVDLVAGVYQVQDMVTTYRPEGDANPKFKYPRDLVVDFNIYWTYRLQEILYVIDKVIVADGKTVTASNTISPKKWLQRIASMAQDFERRALVARADYMIERSTCSIDSSNPNRLNTELSYERTGRVIISSTMAFADSYFGE